MKMVYFIDSSCLSCLKSVVYDFIIIPGLVFDKICHRLGYGYGHYDYFLSRYFAANPSAKSHTKLSKDIKSPFCSLFIS